MKNQETILFKEIQQFRSAWLWGILILSFLLSMGAILFMTYKGDVSGGEIKLSLGILLPVDLFILTSFYYTRLETVITNSSIQFRWWPFMRKYRVISWQDIRDARIKNGMWPHFGFRYVPGYGTVHKVAPGKGIELTLRRGKKIFLGTQKAGALQHVIDSNLPLLTK